MFDILFGWRKASKCKKLINRVQCRLKLLKNKRNSIVRQLREDLAQLIKSGHEHIAFNRVEQLIKDESIAAVYELLDHFCEFILIHLGYIRRHKDCPNDINEAVSSLIFSSARCGDLPELRVIRKLFGERYGQRFAMSAVELFPGNLVNREIKEKLVIQSVPDDVKHRLVDEIARECCLKPEVLALEYYPEWKKQQVKENSGHQVLDTDVRTYYDTTKGSERQASNVSERERKVIYVDSFSRSKNILTERCSSLSHRDSGASSGFTGSSNVQSTSSSVVQQSSPNLVESPMPEKAEKARLNSPYKYTISCLEHKEVRTTTASSSECLPQFSEEAVVYLDDIEEFHSFTKKDGVCQDQRLFKFKSSFLPRDEKIGTSCDQSNMDHYESSSEKSGSRRCRKNGKASGERLRRSMSREKQSTNNIECVIYYDKPCKSSPTNRPRKHQKKTPGVRRQQSYDAPKRLKKPCCLDLGSNTHTCNCKYDPKESFFNHEMDDNSLRHPFYFCSCDDKDLDNREVLPWNRKRGITTLVSFPTHGPERELVCNECCHHHWFWNGESDKEKEWTTIPLKPTRRRYDRGVVVYNVFTYPDFHPNKQNKEMRGKSDRSDLPTNCVCSNVSCHTVASSFTRNETLPPYSRAETMPTERPKKPSKETMLRSNSCHFQYPNHVHPKLPDYDAIAAKFMALKKEHLQNKGCGSNRQPVE